MGRPWHESEADAKADQALRLVESVITDKRISPRHYSVHTERDGAWCLVRDGDRYRVQWSLDRRSAVSFGDVRQAAAYLAGQLTANAADLAADLEETTQPTPTPSGHPGLPPITDAMRAAAARNPGGWVYCADPDADPRYIEGMPLPVLLGGYKVGPDGQFTGETYLNEDYRPSPRRRGYPEPQTEFELILGYVAAGWLPHHRILPAALDAPFLFETDGNRGLRIGVDHTGRRFLAVYSSPRYVPPNAQSIMQTPGRELVPALAGLTLIVNPGGNFGIELPGDDLIRLASGTQPA